MKRRTTRDERDPLVPLTPPMFGVPPRAAQCVACGLWFPFANFLRGDGKARRRVKRCHACIKAHRAASGLAVVLGGTQLLTAAPEACPNADDFRKGQR